jgi:hypothetical protein
MPYHTIPHHTIALATTPPAEANVASIYSVGLAFIYLNTLIGVVQSMLTKKNKKKKYAKSRCNHI